MIRAMMRLREWALRSPAWLQRPMRAGWRGWKKVQQAFWPLVAFPRAIARSSGEKRVLGIYHFQEHAGYLGDMMEYLEVLNVLRAKHRLRKIDLCYIDDPSNRNQPVSRPRVDGAVEFKQMMLELRALLPGVGAVLQFDSDAAFERFFRSHYARYVCWPQYHRLHSWPSRVDYMVISDQGFAYANTYAPIDRYYREHGHLPQLSCPSEALDWARRLIREHALPATPIALQIRFNPDSPARDSNAEAWKAFLARMEPRSDVKFIVLCRREEIVPELRRLRNVVYSKDHGSGVLQDLALIQTCHFSMFPDAGFCTYPWFCGVPTIYFGREKHEFPERRFQNANGEGLRFLSKFQRRRFGAYSADILEAEFQALWRDLAAAGWSNPHLAG